MEIFLLKRSKASSIADRSSGDRLVFKEKASREGNRQLQRQRNSPKLSSPSSSCSSGSTEEDRLTFDSGRRSSKQVIGIPMKKLLAEEMSREPDSKRRSPGLVAKLMGLDVLPPQQPTYRQQKKLSEQRTTSVEFRKNDASFDIRPRRKSSKEQEEFKDVFEVLEPTKMENRLQWAVNSKLTEAEMAFIRQKFMDAKRLSTDEKLQDTKEFHDALEVLDSNKDLLLKFLEQRDPLFTKHLHDLQDAPQSRRSRVAARKSADGPKYGNNCVGFKSDRGISRKNSINSPHKHHDDFLSNSYSRGTCNVLKPSRSRIEGKDETSTLPTRIVVLKPNLGKAQNVAKSVPSPDSSPAFLSNCRMHSDFPIAQSRDTDGDVRLPRHKSRESREIAKEITRKMRNSLSTGSIEFSPSRFKGYAGDESSCYLSANDSAYESEATTLASRSSFDLNNRHKPSLSGSSNSSVNREAKKRLSERWKMTHKIEEVGGGFGKGSSTLGEMLAIPDRETRQKDSSTKIHQDGSRGRFATIEVNPLGISSRDGWKDGCYRNISRSRSFPASPTAPESLKTSTRRESLADERYLIPKEVKNRGRNKGIKGDLDHKEGSSSSRNVRSSSRKSGSSSHRASKECTTDTSLEVHVESKPENEDCSELKSMVSETILAPDENITTSPDKSASESSASMLVKGESSIHDMDNSVSQELSEESSTPFNPPVIESEFSVSSKVAADQPSPVSVLEPTITDDPSSGSECFESLTADLYGLRMQLQLLKMESEAPYAEGPMAISSDDEAAPEENIISRVEESWESSYIIDVLVDSGFNDTDPDTFITTWHTSESPVSPLLFKQLENKYSEQTTSSRYERKLLFDRINSGLVDIFADFINPHPWVKTQTRLVSPKRSKNSIEDDLCKLLTGEMKGSEDITGKESKWMDLGEEIDVIGREVERLLIDELVVEVINM